MTKTSKLKSSIELKEHQKDALDFILENNGRALLAHDTGTGKTLSSIAGFEELKKQKKAKKALVLMPASLLTNFRDNGIKKFTNSTYGDVGENKDYSLMSMEMFRRDPESVMTDNEFDTLIVDEIHRAKDPQSVTNKSMRYASENVDNVIGVTGSFISNHPRDIVPLLDIVSPEHSFGSQSTFGKKHTKREVRSSGFLKPNVSKVKLKNESVLADKIKGKIHYVTHSDMGGGMPALEEENVYVPMSKKQSKAYSFALGRLDPVTRRKIRNGLPVNQKEASHIFSIITQARQASNSIEPFYSDVDLTEGAKETPKVSKMLDDLEEYLGKTPDGQVAIHTNFVRGGADVLDAGLKDRGINHGIFAGHGSLGATKENRDEAVKRFNSGKDKVILLTPAGGEGVNLPDTTMFMTMDRHYNPERNNQAIARGRRLGGQSNRKEEDRKLIVKNYYSEPKSRNGLLEFIAGKEVGIDEWVNGISEEKNRLNRDMRNVVSSSA